MIQNVMERILVLALGICGFLACTPKRFLTQSEIEHQPPLRLQQAVAEPRRMIEVDGVSIAIHDSDPSGQKPAIVCLHAIGHGGADFAAFETAFGDTFRIVTVDWPGHGASGIDVKPASAQRYAELLPSVLDQLGIENPILFGNSIGGAASIVFAQKHPERVRALILCNPGGLDPGGFVADWFIGNLVNQFRRGVAREADYLAWYRNYYSKILLGPQAEKHRAAIIAAGYETAPRLVEAWVSFTQPEANLRNAVRALRLPVFVGWAMRDGLVQWGRNQDAILSLPELTLVRFENSGHAPFLEESDAFQKAVAPFLAKLR